MINKKNIWFLTLFSLILVLSVYYITMPNELLLTNIDTTQKKDITVTTSESDILTVLRVENDEAVSKELDSLKVILSDQAKSTDEKNEAFNKMKTLNINKTDEKNLEKSIKEEFKLDSFVKINNDQIKVVTIKDKHDKSLANKIMRFIQKKYDTKKYITVEFK